MTGGIFPPFAYLYYYSTFCQECPPPDFVCPKTAVKAVPVFSSSPDFLGGFLLLLGEDGADTEEEIHQMEYPHTGKDNTAYDDAFQAHHNHAYAHQKRHRNEDADFSKFRFSFFDRIKCRMAITGW